MKEKEAKEIKKERIKKSKGRSIKKCEKKEGQQYICQKKQGRIHGTICAGTYGPTDPRTYGPTDLRTDGHDLI